MSSQVPAIFSGAQLPQNASDAAEALQRSVASTPKPERGQQFMNLGQAGSPHEGTLVYGVDATPVPPEARWVLNIASAQHGWCMRVGKNVSDKRMFSLFEELPIQPNPPASAPKEARFSLFYWLEMACVASPDESMLGDVVILNNDARGLVAMVREQLMPQISEKFAGVDEIVFPVITLSVSSYYSTKWGKDFYNPNATIVGWMTEAQVAEGGVEEQEAPAGKPKRQRK